MKGMIDAVKGEGATSAAPDMGGAPRTTEPTADGDTFARLAEIEQHVETSLPDSLRKAYLAIVLAGRQLMFSEQTHPKMAEYMTLVNTPEDVPQRTAHLIMKLLQYITDDLKQKGREQEFSVPAAGAAAITLMTHALKYVDGQLEIPITPPIIDQTTQAVVKGLLAFFKVDEPMMREVLQHAAQQQPEAAGAPEAGFGADEEAEGLDAPRPPAGTAADGTVGDEDEEVVEKTPAPVEDDEED